MKKRSLYNLSLMFLYISIIILVFDASFFFDDSKFFSLKKILSLNIIIFLVCLIMIIWGVITFFSLKGWLRSSPEMPKTIIKVQQANECYLEFLAAYIIPLVCFDFSNTRQVVVFIIFYLLIGWIYIRTNLFCTNPTLAFLGYDVYRVIYRNDTTNLEKEVFVFAGKEILTLKNQKARFINIDDSIYMLYQQKKG